MTSYSLANTVTAFHSFYNFLTTLPSDITPASILLPPVRGWPSLTPQYLSSLGKDPTVINLLQHLPYIAANNGMLGSTKIAYQTDAIDFRSPAKCRTIERGNIEGLLEPPDVGGIPEWVVCLSCGGRDASWLLLDTQEGTITDYIQQARPEKDEPGQDSQYHWKAYHTKPIVEFLEEWKDNYRTLKWVVVPQNVDDAVKIQQNKETDVSPAIRAL